MEIICVTNRLLCAGDFLSKIEEVSKSDVSKIILREKDLEFLEYEKLAKKCSEICERNNTKFYTNTFVTSVTNDIHVPFHIFKSLLNEENLNLSVSVHSIDEAVFCEKNGAKFLIAGHIFKTDCKKDLAPRGVSFLEEITKSVKIPVYAIGGMTKKNAPTVINAGAKGICLMSSIMKN